MPGNQTIQDAQERVDTCRNDCLSMASPPSEEFLLQFRTELNDLLKVIEEALSKEIT